MTSEQLSATTTIPVTLAEVFAVLADPTSHAATSSVRTGWVNGAIDTEPITKAGQVFLMGMFHPTWSETDQESREVIGFPPFGVDHLQDSLGRLAAFVTSRGPRPGAPAPA